jgi:hypothetical protein
MSIDGGAWARAAIDIIYFLIICIFYFSFLIV